MNKIEGYKLFLDDYRQPIDCIGYMYHRIGGLNPIYLEKDWVVAKNYEEFVDIIEKMGEPGFISYDHDLADEHYFDADRGFDRGDYEEKTGLDCAKWYLETYKKHPDFAVHSMNPAGGARIKQYIDDNRI